jgi:hypothetical protein
LAADFPTQPECRSALALYLNNLGVLLEKTGRLKKAEVANTDALTSRSSG